MPVTHNYVYAGTISHNCWMDEEIVDEDWYPEMSARLLDRNGRFIWSATPQAGTDQLYELHERSLEERLKPKPSVEEFIILLDDNPHIEEEEKTTFAEALSDEDRKVRVGGEFALISFKVYPEFSMMVHGVDYFEIPENWCRYMVVDPGHQVCACLFAAVPPKEEGDFLYLYDELYLKECDAATFAKQVQHKTRGHTFQAFYIDPNAAVLTEIASGKSIGQQYSEQLSINRVTSVATGSGFAPGADEIEAGIMAVHGLLRKRESGPARLKVLRGVLNNFEFEIKRYHKKRVGGIVQDKPDQKRHNHLMDALRYLAMANVKYVTPPKKSGKVSGALAAFRAKEERRKKKDGGDYTRLGPGSQRRDDGR